MNLHGQHRCSYCGLRSGLSKEAHRLFQCAHICEACRQMMPLNTHACHSCAEPMNPQQSTENKCGPNLCQSCREQPVPWDNVIAPLVYAYPIKESIHRFKYNKHFAYGQALVQLLLEKLVAFYAHRPFPDVIIPVPQHSSRALERGFNPSLWLARAVSRCLKCQVTPNLVWQTKKAKPQNQLPLTDRKINLRGSFSIHPQYLTVPPGCQSTNYQGKHFAVFDDVMTTGTTAREVVKVLTSFNPIKIDVWCLARTPNDKHYTRRSLVGIGQ